MRISDWSSYVCSSDLAIGDPDRNRLLGRKEACVDQQRGRAARTHHAREEIADAGVRTKAEPRISGREAGRVRADQAIGRYARKSIVQGKSVSVRLDLGGRRINKKQYNNTD